MAERILFVEDDRELGEQVTQRLRAAGFDVTWWTEGRRLSPTDTAGLSLVILDLMLPGTYGMEILADLRKSSEVPVLVLSARNDSHDKVRALKLGADDYMTKPFNPRELTARVKAILRRQERAQAPASGPTLTVGDVVVDVPGRTVRVSGQPVALRVKEFDVLLALIQHRDTVLSRDRLLDLAWGVEFFTQTRTVDVHVAQVRKALAGSRSVRIETVTGIGYKLTAG